MNEAALRAAGLFGLPFSWGSDGVLNFGPSMTQEQRDAVTAFFATYGPQQIFEEAKATELAKFRNDRKEMFSVIVGMGWAASEAGDTTTVTKLLAFREGLKDLPDWPAVVAATTHLGLKQAMAARYKTLTDALPAAVKADFKKLYVP